MTVRLSDRARTPSFVIWSRTPQFCQTVGKRVAEKFPYRSLWRSAGLGQSDSPSMSDRHKVSRTKSRDYCLGQREGPNGPPIWAAMFWLTCCASSITFVLICSANPLYWPDTNEFRIPAMLLPGNSVQPFPFFLFLSFLLPLALNWNTDGPVGPHMLDWKGFPAPNGRFWFWLNMKGLGCSQTVFGSTAFGWFHIRARFTLDCPVRGILHWLAGGGLSQKTSSSWNGALDGSGPGASEGVRVNPERGSGAVGEGGSVSIGKYCSTVISSDFCWMPRRRSLAHWTTSSFSSDGDLPARKDGVNYYRLYRTESSGLNPSRG